MDVRDVSHIGLGVRDMERSLHFYRDLLGLEVVSDTLHVQEAHQGLLKDTQRAQRRAVHLCWQESQKSTFLVLSQPVGEAAGEAISMDQVGIHHFSLWVNDVRALYEKLRSAGVEIMRPPLESEPDGAAVRIFGSLCVTAQVRDPDGIIVQLDQLGT